MKMRWISRNYNKSQARSNLLQGINVELDCETEVISRFDKKESYNSEETFKTIKGVCM